MKMTLKCVFKKICSGKPSSSNLSFQTHYIHYQSHDIIPLRSFWLETSSTAKKCFVRGKPPLKPSMSPRPELEF
jgi:hypothetical protein